MKHLSNIDLCQNELQNAVLQNLASAPAYPKAGQIYFDSASSKFYGHNGSGWIDLGQVLTGASIVSLINASSSAIDDDNLSEAVQDAINKRHSHANATVLNAMEQAFTTALKNKLDGIAASATKVEKSNTNGNIKINGVETNVYTNPGTIAWESITGKPSTFTPPVASSDTIGGIKVGANLTVAEDGTLKANDNPASYICKQEEFIATYNQTLFTLKHGTYTPKLGTMAVFIDGVKMNNTLFKETSTNSITLKIAPEQGSKVLLEYVELANVEPATANSFQHGIEHITGGDDPIPEATQFKNGLMSATDKIKLDGTYTKQQADSAISKAVNDLVNGAEGALDTLKELADAMGNDANFATTVTNNLAQKVDKESGKGLSTNDFTTQEKQKLQGVEYNANHYTHPLTHEATIIKEDSTHRFVTDVEKEKWNNVKGGTQKYTGFVGDGYTTTVNIRHNLNTEDVTVTVRENSSTKSVIYTDIQIVDSNNIKLLFANAPSQSQYKVVVTG